MTLSLERALLVVHDIQPTGLCAGGPLVPETWECSPHDADVAAWYELVRPDGVRMFARRENSNGVLGLFAVFGSADVLAEINQAVTLSLPASEAWRRRDEAGVRAYLRYWRTVRGTGQYRATDIDGNPVAVPWSGVRTVIPEGAQLPDWTVTPLPWNLAADGSLTTMAQAVVRVETVVRPSLFMTAAGLGCGDLLESEPDTGGGA